MSGNAIPQFCKNGTFGTPQAVAAALVRSDGVAVTGIGTDIYKLLTADATNGSLVEFVRVMVAANAAGISTNATVLRFYISTVTSGNTAAADTHLIYEVAIPIIVAASATLANNPIDIPLNLRLPAGTTLLVSSHIAAASNTWWVCTPYGGDY